VSNQLPLRRAQTLAFQALFCLLLAVLLAACGSSASAGGGAQSSSSAATNATLDACALVTRAEAETLLGVPVGEPKSEAVSKSVTTCILMPTVERDLRHLFVWYNPRPNADNAHRFFDETKAAPAKYGAATPTRDQAGIGDSAFWLGDILWVLKGKTIISVSADNEANTAQLANLVLRRLP
jgi:hypothetical protein